MFIQILNEDTCIYEAPVVYPDDLTRYFGQWDQQLQSSITKLNDVEQPLKYLLPEKIKRRVHQIAKGKQPLESILNCYYQPEKEYYYEL